MSTSLLFVVLLSISTALPMDHFEVIPSPTDLQCDADTEPVGVDADRPGFSWQIPVLHRGAGQTAYQIQVASSPERLEGGTPDYWDSQKVSSSDFISARYAGKLLPPSTVMYWRVKYWDEQLAASGWSPNTRFTTGLHASDWQAHWISAPSGPDAPLPVFRKSFVLLKPVVAATIHICGLGQYDLYINGRKCSRFLQPGWTLYSKTSLYDSYDVLPNLTQGDNVLGVMLGNGMYNVQKSERYTKFTGSFGTPKLIAQLQLRLADGTVQTITSDSTWKVAPGPITFSNIYGGEDFDARLVNPAWATASFSDTAWKPAEQTNSPAGPKADEYGVLKGHSYAPPPLRTFEALTPISIRQLSASTSVYDLGQNVSLIPKLTVHGPSGSSVRLTPTELLNADGTPDRRSIAPVDRLSYWQYTLGGDSKEEWQPQFSYQGARYLYVERFAAPGAADLPHIDALEGAVVHADVAPVGEFHCSNELFNRIHDIIRWAQRSNLVSVITDCPHRERLGWLEQYHLHGPSLRYEFDLSRLYAKCLQDMVDSQTASGLVPDIAPEYIAFKGGFRDSPEWGSAIALVAWQQYQWTGDDSVLATHYDAIKRYADYLNSKANGHLLDYGLGDWYDIGPKPPGYAQRTPRGLTATAFYYETTRILAEAAAALHYETDAKKYAGRVSEIVAAFNGKYLNNDTGVYAGGSQTAQAIPLVMQLVPPALHDRAVDVLVKNVQSQGLTAGDIGHRYLLRALADAGRSDVIYQLHTRSDTPGYASILSKGATALTEAWDARPDSSQNHFMLGHIMEWFYADLAGIAQAPDSKGWEDIALKPTPLKDLSFVRASFRSPRGMIACSWTKTETSFNLDVTLPAGSTTTLFLPADASIRPDDILESGWPVAMCPDAQLVSTTASHRIFTLRSGTYSFKVPVNRP